MPRCQSLYLVTSGTQYAQTGVIATDDFNTHLHKFALNGTRIDYRGSAVVAGHLGQRQDLESVSPERISGRPAGHHFRGTPVAPGQSPATLYTLQEQPGQQQLEVIARLPNDRHPTALGTPGAQFHEAHFFGTHAYLTPTRVTDPLYALDLSDPADPKVVTELTLDHHPITCSPSDPVTCSASARRRFRMMTAAMAVAAGIRASNWY
ncbi:MAG: beta-propeller domain-containing protein [Thiolinea sp.]